MAHICSNAMSAVVTDIVTQIYHLTHRYLQMLLLFPNSMMFLSLFVDLRIFYISVHLHSRMIFVCHFLIEN